MFARDNIYYFPKNIDVRSCPKNASLSLRSFHTNVMKYVHEEDEVSFFGMNEFILSKWKKVLSNADFFDIPFRKKSIRFALKRDPIDRFKSAVEMLQASTLFDNMSDVDKMIYPEEKYYRHYDSVTTLLNDLEDNVFVDVHFLPQTYYLDGKNKYDFIYDVKEFAKFQKHILLLNDISWSEKKWSLRLNVSNNTSKNELERLQQSDNGFIESVQNYDIEQNYITHNITVDDLRRIKNLYQIDYDNGWC